MIEGQRDEALRRVAALGAEDDLSTRTAQDEGWVEEYEGVWRQVLDGDHHLQVEDEGDGFVWMLVDRREVIEDGAADTLSEAQGAAEAAWSDMDLAEEQARDWHRAPGMQWDVDNPIVQPAEFVEGAFSILFPAKGGGGHTGTGLYPDQETAEQIALQAQERGQIPRSAWNPFGGESWSDDLVRWHGEAK